MIISGKVKIYIYLLHLFLKNIQTKQMKKTGRKKKKNKSSSQIQNWLQRLALFPWGLEQTQTEKYLHSNTENLPVRPGADK